METYEFNKEQQLEAEMNYWYWQATQLARKSRRCLNCISDEQVNEITMKCRRCDRLERNWEKENEINTFYKQQAMARQEVINRLKRQEETDIKVYLKELDRELKKVFKLEQESPAVVKSRSDGKQ